MTAGVITEAELDALFDGATHSIFRLETLPAYSVDSEVERFAAWRDGRPRPLRSVRTDSFLAEIAAGTLAGVDWERVRVVDDPLTDYQRYQLAGYLETQAVGCSIGLIPRRRVVEGCPDFWLFDHGTDHAAAVTLLYSPTGRPVGVERAPVAALDAVRQAVSDAAVPLNDFLASVARV